MLTAICGLVVTLAGAMVARKAPGVFFAQTQVRFVIPLSSDNPNGLGVSTRSLISAAGVVAKIVDPDPLPPPNDESITIVGMGVRDGWSVTLPQTGGQFVPGHTEPWLDVQVAGSNPDEVKAQMDQLLVRIPKVLNDLEQQRQVSAENLIRTKLVPEGEPEVTYLHGSRSRSALAVLILGVSLTGAAMALLRRVAR
ncbi:hypothetical protein SAMN05892883_4433 [Jatrophihabitans sp. GAS493]|nr:hypothetical protein SAMN05892883_0021 [Jatrophihabitans sp. GAS493]SOD75222.1 hypothetical protein SAMN05892883_4433 [Jatrophihabitans sp. GAS493]